LKKQLKKKITGDENKTCFLKDFKFLLNTRVIIEEDADLATNEFTRLLENLFKEKPPLLRTNYSSFNGTMDVEAFIKQLGTLVSNLESVQ
jgi:hypothetical protein